MALPNGGIFEARATATAGNVNSGGFNPENANFLTDLEVIGATGNTDSPVVHSPSYAFDSTNDIGAKVFIQSGVNWISGWYSIVSVDGITFDATLDATIGNAVSYNSASRQILPSTISGVSTVATPTGGVFGIDYSQQDAARFNYSDLAIDAVTNTIVTSAARPFVPAHVGNFLHTTAGVGFTQGWFELVSISESANATLDRSAGTLGSTGGTSKMGGALSFNSLLDDDAYEMMVGGNILYFMFGTFLLGEPISVANNVPTAILRIYYEGYNTVRGDRPIGTTRPTIVAAGNTFYVNLYKTTRNLIITGTTADLYGSNTVCQNIDCKFLNTSFNTNRNAFTIYANTGQLIDSCEMVSQNGIAIEAGAVDAIVTDCYIHDSLFGISMGVNTRPKILENVFENCDTDIFVVASSYAQISENTFYGQETPVGVGVNLTTAPSNTLTNNIFYGKTTAINQTASAQASTISDYNNFFNNTTNRTNVAVGPNDMAINPSFINATQITGTTATSAGNVLTQPAGDFSTVEDNVDYLTVVSGTGVTVGKYLIVSHTIDTVTTNNALGPSVAGDIVYRIGTGHNFGVGPALADTAKTLPPFETVSYMEVGGVQSEDVPSAGGGNVCVSII